MSSTTHIFQRLDQIKNIVEYSMVASLINQPEDLHHLAETCRNLESRCAAYIRYLEVAYDNLAHEITKRRKT